MLANEMTACWAGEEAFQHGRNVSDMWPKTSLAVMSEANPKVK
jgi:hypothetical protein